MTSAFLVRATARVSDVLFRHAFPVYAALYERYKTGGERGLIALVRRAVRPGDRVVDVGANVGFYSELLARGVGPSGHVHAFEPEPRNFRRLAARAAALPQLHPVAAAVAERPGRVDLHLSPHLNVDHRTYSTGEARAVITAEAVSLDSFFARGEQVHFIKMDIQGAEYPALLGMRTLVARSPEMRIVMEFWPYAHDHDGVGTGAVIALVESWGLHVHRLAPETGLAGERLTPATVFPERDDVDAYFDVICARSGMTPR